MEAVNFTESQIRVVDAVKQQYYHKGILCGVLFAIAGLVGIVLGIWAASNFDTYYIKEFMDLKSSIHDTLHWAELYVQSGELPILYS